MVSAMLADVEILMQFQIVDHGVAVRTLVPQAFRHVFTAVQATEAGFTENAHVSGELRDRVLGSRDDAGSGERNFSGGCSSRQSPFDRHPE